MNMKHGLFNQNFYFLGSRALTHLVFWLVYYISFSLIWMKPEVGYLGSFFLEFVLLPVRLLAVYSMLYFLMPMYLLERRFKAFTLAYVVMLLLAGLLHRLSDHFFYETLFLGETTPLWQLSEWVRGILLVNSTVVLVAAIRLLQLYFQVQDKLQRESPKPIEVKSNRRTYLLRPDQIRYIEGMGNYVNYHLDDGTKLVVYASIKGTLEFLPPQFIRLHKSYIVNRQHIASFSADEVSVGEQVIPRGKDVSDQALQY